MSRKAPRVRIPPSPPEESLSSCWAISLLKCDTLIALLSDCQDVVGHRESDFDFYLFLSQIFPYVICVLIDTIFFLAAPLGVRVQPIHQPKENLVVLVDFNPDDMFCSQAKLLFVAELLADAKWLLRSEDGEEIRWQFR